MAEHIVGRVDEIDDGERLIVQLEGREIAIFRIEDEYFAYANWCPHQSGPCGEGSVSGMWTASFDKASLSTEMDYVKEDEVLNCPWHGWEFDLRTGECFSRRKVRLPSYSVQAEGEDIVVSL